MAVLAEERRWKIRLEKVLIASVLGRVSAKVVSERLCPRRSPTLNVSSRA